MCHKQLIIYEWKFWRGMDFPKAYSKTTIIAYKEGENGGPQRVNNT